MALPDFADGVVRRDAGAEQRHRHRGDRQVGHDIGQHPCRRVRSRFGVRCLASANAHRTQRAGKRALESIATTTRIVQQRGEPRMAHPDEPQCAAAAMRERFA